ncbi:MAG: bifunctional DNA-formamidopyrimidine glycosylase/DNA-(apurinic or apyrimidinic site) lyase [Chloroflexota bacterium]
MPEMPEVETMVRDLQPRIVGRSLTTVEASFSGAVIFPDYPEFVNRVSGQRIEGITRRGKYALLALASGDVLIIHRGMSGSLLLRRSDDPPERYMRALFRLDDGRELRFTDPRKFGKLFVMEGTGAERPLPWDKMGPEPLDTGFTVEHLRTVLTGRSGPIKPLLLGQRIVAGLGNIYVDEALYRARIHPRTIAGTLGAEEIDRLHSAIRRVLSEAIERRGTTFNNYTDIEGLAGAYQSQLLVFRRTGDDCPTCGTPIERIVLQGRGTHFCPRCQQG